MINFPIDIVVLDTVDSTNSYAKQLAYDGDIQHGKAIIALEQTQGRGRLGRSWLSKSGKSLCMSLLLKAGSSPAVTLLTAIAVQKALGYFCSDEKLEIKWPNDIIVRGKKLCGILCERCKDYTVIGIGVNVLDDSFSDEIKEKATSLFLVSKKEFDIMEVANRIILSVQDVFTEYNYCFDKKAHDEYMLNCANIGKTVTRGDITGIAVDVAESGALVVQNSQGGLCLFDSGEVLLHGVY